MKKFFIIIFIVLIVVSAFYFITTKSSSDDSMQDTNIANVKSAVQEEPISNTYNITVVNADESKKFSISNSSSAYISSEIADSKVILKIKESAKDIILLDGMSGKTATEYTVTKLKGVPSKVVAGQLHSLTSFPTILVITTDGYVENVNSELGFKKGSFESTGYIDSLENIVDIIPVTVEYNNSTYLSLLAIDEKNNGYEITQDMLN